MGIFLYISSGGNSFSLAINSLVSANENTSFSGTALSDVLELPAPILVEQTGFLTIHS